MEQVTFADVEYEGKKRRTRRELFLERMEARFRGSVWRRGFGRCIRRRAGGGSRTRWRRC